MTQTLRLWHFPCVQNISDSLTHSTYIGFIIGGDQVKNAKPAPDIYLKAASCVNAEVGSCIAFEDSDVGVMAAHAAGVPVIQIPDICRPSEKCIAFGHLIFNSLDKARDELGWR